MTRLPRLTDRLTPISIPLNNPKENTMVQTLPINRLTMTKFFAIIVILVLALFSFGCGGGGTDTTPTECDPGFHRDLITGACVPNVVVDTTPPTVAIQEPTNGSTLTVNAISVKVTASDASGIASVIVKIDGQVLAGSPLVVDNVYTFDWDLPVEANTDHSVEVCAKDNGTNHMETCQTVAVTVNNMVTDVCAEWRTPDNMMDQRRVTDCPVFGGYAIGIINFYVEQGVCKVYIYIDRAGGVAVDFASNMIYTRPPTVGQPITMTSAAPPYNPFTCVLGPLP